MLTALLPLWAPLEFVLNLFKNWGPGILLLSFLVVFHEFGHYVVAKRLKVPVNRFSLGFGPRLFGVQIGETDYCVSAFPLGGYVSMAGEVPGPDGEMVPVDHFAGQTWWKRWVIGVAGPGANLIGGYIAMVVVGLIGVSYDDYLPRIGPVEQGSPAAATGFMLGQNIDSVDGQPVESWHGFVQAVLTNENDVTVSVSDESGASKTMLLTKEEREPVLSGLSPFIEPIVGRVAVGFPAYSGGLREGDRIEAVNGSTVTYWEDLTRLIHGAPAQEITLSVNRNGNQFETKIKTVEQQINGVTVGVIGITPPRDSNYIFRPGTWASFRDAVPLTATLVKRTAEGMWTLVSRPQQAKDQVGGPLLIMRMSSEQARRGLSDFLFLMGVISIAIMAFNLLPLPALDGGHMLIAVLEGIRRRPLAQGFLTAYQRLGLALIGFLLVFIIFNDFWREAKRGRAVSIGDKIQTESSE